MMKIILLPLALGAVLICGCQRDTDTATIDALNKKIDWLVQSQSVVCSNESILTGNQAALSARIDFVSRQIGALPDSNTMAVLQNRIDYDVGSQAEFDKMLGGVIITNLARLERVQSHMQLQLIEIDGRTAGIENYLTNK
jgi:hypothetical protein